MTFVKVLKGPCHSPDLLLGRREGDSEWGGDEQVG